MKPLQPGDFLEVSLKMLSSFGSVIWPDSLTSYLTPPNQTQCVTCAKGPEPGCQRRSQQRGDLRGWQHWRPTAQGDHDRTAASPQSVKGEEKEQRMCCRWRHVKSKLTPDARRGDKEEEAGRSADGAGQCGCGSGA